MPWFLLLLALSPHARRRWWLWGAALVAAPRCGEALQELVGRLRPQGTALGFPSGHATAIAAFAVATSTSSAGRACRELIRSPSAWSALLLMLAIGLSRMVLDAHWTLDVVAGFALGAAGAAAAAWWDASHPVPPPLPATGSASPSGGTALGPSLTPAGAPF